jgi:hypothetical protein
MKSNGVVSEIKEHGDKTYENQRSPDVVRLTGPCYVLTRRLRHNSGRCAWAASGRKRSEHSSRHFTGFYVEGNHEIV